MEDLYFEKVHSADVTVPFKYVYFNLKKQRVILPSDKIHRGVLKFNEKRAQVVLNQFLTNNLSGLTLNETPNQDVSLQNTRYPRNNIRKFFGKATVPVEACITGVGSSQQHNDATGKHFVSYHTIMFSNT